MPDKGWSTPDMFVPPGYHMGASLSGVEKPEKEQSDVPYTYAPNTGVGYVMMNGCWGTNYTASDPCYNAKWDLKCLSGTLQKFNSVLVLPYTLHVSCENGLTKT